ncbi:MAG: HAD family hydrolase [Phycisphaerales bacterium]|nr:MAG: HAD family hydrolase [Phycisphaerales bacterium]
MTGESAVILDFDGTITKPYLDFDAIRSQIGVEGTILEAMARMDEKGRRRADVILLEHERDAAENATLQDGAAEVLAELRRRGHPVAILTRNSRMTLGIVLPKFGIIVDAIRTREDGAIKPSPEPVLSICREVGADPCRSWMVGDYLFDVISGTQAGTRTALMVGDAPVPEYADQADHVIRRLGELLSLVDAGIRSGPASSTE